MVWNIWMIYPVINQRSHHWVHRPVLAEFDCLESSPGFVDQLFSMDWFKGKFSPNKNRPEFLLHKVRSLCLLVYKLGKPHIYWENLWFPVDFPLNQSIDIFRVNYPAWLWLT